MNTDAPSLATALAQLRTTEQARRALVDVRNAYDLEYGGGSQEFLAALPTVSMRTLADAQATYDALVAKLPAAESGASWNVAADPLSEAFPGINTSRLFCYQPRSLHPREAYTRVCATFIRHATKIKAIIAPIDPKNSDCDAFGVKLTAYLAAKPAAPAVVVIPQASAATPAPKPASLAASASSATSPAARPKSQLTGLARTIAALQAVAPTTKRQTPTAAGPANSQNVTGYDRVRAAFQRAETAAGKN